MFQAYHEKYSSKGTTRKLFFDASLDIDELSLISPVLKTEVGKAGTFTFTLPVSNVESDNFEEFISYVDIYRNSELIYTGRVSKIEKNFYCQTSITCEGLLTLLNDSILAPRTFQQMSLYNLINSILNSHNSQVDSYKKINPGKITVSDNNIYREYKNYETTMSRLNDIINSYGGYMSVRKTDDKLYFDYVLDFDEKADQTIDFGSNLLDLNQTTNNEELITVLIPLGATVQSGDESYQVDITSVNDGKNYLENTDAISKFGRIVGVQEWTDVEQPLNLKKKGNDYLTDKCKPRIVINVNAIDMAKYGSDINFFKSGEYIYINSDYHDIHEYILAKSQTLYLLQPDSNTMSLGETFIGYVSKNNSSLNKIASEIQKIESGDIEFNINTITNSDIDDITSS